MTCCVDPRPATRQYAPWVCDGKWHKGWDGHDPYAVRCPFDLPIKVGGIADDLPHLAQRCERTPCQDPALDEAIQIAVRGEESLYSYRCARLVARPYTASWDAALSLIPEGWRLSQIISGGSRFAVSLERTTHKLLADYPPPESNAASGPLAICAAALKAHALAPIEAFGRDGETRLDGEATKAGSAPTTPSSQDTDQ